MGKGSGTGGKGGGWGKKEKAKNPGLRKVKVRAGVEEGRDSQENQRADTHKRTVKMLREVRGIRISHWSELLPLSTVGTCPLSWILQ